MNPIDTILLAFLEGRIGNGDDMVLAWRDLCESMARGFRPTFDVVSRDFIAHLVYIYWDKIIDCIRVCQSVGDLLALYESGYVEFEGIMETMHIRFYELANAGQIDMDRMNNVTLIKLLGWEEARRFMRELEAFPVLAPVPRRNDTGNRNDCQYQQRQGHVQRAMTIMDGNTNITPVCNIKTLPPPPSVDTDGEEIFEVPPITPPEHLSTIVTREMDHECTMNVALDLLEEVDARRSSTLMAPPPPPRYEPFAVQGQGKQMNANTIPETSSNAGQLSLAEEYDLRNNFIAQPGSSRDNGSAKSEAKRS